MREPTTSGPESLSGARARDLWLAETKSFVERIGIPGRLEEVASGLEATRSFRRCFAEWDRLPPRQRRRRFEELCRATERAAYALRPYCLRCGECCRRQSPALHEPDLCLVTEGAIGLEHLLTLRRGEWAWSAQKEAVVVLAAERVKVRQLPSGACPFFEEANHSCAIYERRPLECRALACWQPADFARATRAPHLKRADIARGLQLGGKLVELVRRHDEGIDLARLGGDGLPKDDRLVLQALALDEALRREAVELHAADPAWEGFLFGRALRELLANR